LPRYDGEPLDERIAICEEDVGSFIQGVLGAAAAMGQNNASRARRTADERYREIRITYPNAYRSWSPEEDAQLLSVLAQEKSRDEIAQLFGRQPGAIRSRIDKLTLRSDPIEPEII
jgi:hypothetical protein